MAPQVLSSVPKAAVLSIALAISAGVMIYVSFIEIFVKAQDSILSSYPEDKEKREGLASAITTACFFAGMAICVFLELIVHALHKRFSPSLSMHELQVDLQAGAIARVQTSDEGESEGSVAELGQVRIESSAADASAAEGDASAAEEEEPESVTADSVTNSTAPLDPRVQQPGKKPSGKPKLAVFQQEGDDGFSAADLFNGAPGEGNPEEKARLSKLGAMTAVAIALHNLPEGLATFLATVADPSVGIALGVAIAVHNIPEGVCVAMPIYYATGSRFKAHPPTPSSPTPSSPHPL